MATFQYIAKDASGNETRGQIEAGDRNSAIAAVRAQGLFPTALGEVKRAATPQPAAQKKAAPKRGGAPAAPASKKGGLNMELNIKLPSWMRLKN